MQSGRCCCPGGSTPQQFYRRRSFKVVQFCMGELGVTLKGGGVKWGMRGKGGGNQHLPHH